MPSLRDRILAKAGPKVVPVETAEAGKVYVRELTGIERDAIDEMVRGDKDTFSKPAWRGRLAAMFLSDEAGVRIFDPTKDADELNAMSSAFLDKVIDAGNNASGLGQAGVDKAKANFPENQSDASGSASPEK